MAELAVVFAILDEDSQELTQMTLFSLAGQSLFEFQIYFVLNSQKQKELLEKELDYYGTVFVNKSSLYLESTQTTHEELFNLGIEKVKENKIVFALPGSIFFEDCLKDYFEELPESKDNAITFGLIKKAIGNLNNRIWYEVSQHLISKKVKEYWEEVYQECTFHSFCIDRRRVSQEELFFKNQNSIYDFLSRNARNNLKEIVPFQRICGKMLELNTNTNESNNTIEKIERINQLSLEKMKIQKERHKTSYLRQLIGLLHFSFWKYFSSKD